MEDSESAKKQENTGIGPASEPNRAMSTEAVTSSSCAGRSASSRAFTPVFDGLWTRVNALMTRPSIFFARSLYEEGWIASQLGLARVAQYYAPQVGQARLAVSSPGMTARASSPRGAPRDARVAGTPLRGPMITAS